MERALGALTVELATAETAGLAYGLVREFLVSIGKEAEFTITEAEFRRNLLKDQPPFEVVVALIDGEIAGYALFRVAFDTWAGHENMHISAIYVRPAFRPRHLAAAIYLFLARLASQRGYAAIAGFVPRWNEALLNVYRAAGAEFTEYVMCELKLDQIPGDVFNLGAPRASTSGATS
jgi:ribosomal protein S18 acetylase RimI-like enzyme